ncbi:GGDEF domain-containing protein [Halospina denitrificans]|uniref:GGDEF domain-containing protein n=1 Tax=Halospina denitrificans TaxID=332522 RepID=UPI001414E1CD|nr:GGDEF domain-containing protein [Halospina denitrificans]
MQHQYKQARKRFQADFRLSLITLFCLPAAIAIGGFAVFRSIDGNWLMAIVDLLLVAALLGILIFSWCTGRTRGAGIVLVLVTGCGVLAVVYLAGLVGLFWAFVDVIASFFLSPPMFAVPKVIILTGASLVLGAEAGLGTLPLISFATTIFIVSVFAYSFAIRSKAQADELEELATRDSLTGAGNRRMLEDELRIAIARFDRDTINTGLLMLDLDYFKQINDKYGHAEGDDVLRHFATLVESHSRRGDRFFRFGGEEFVLLLQDVDLHGLETAARHIHQVIRDYLTCSGGEVTCSIGGALIREDDNWERWLQRADQALYRAKGAGRDTIVLADPEAA